MIEQFRHEALNQISVISGFSEIIENELLHFEHPINETFNTHLSKINQLALSFHQTLQVFREGCELKPLTEEAIRLLDPSDDILRYLSPECAIQYTVLKETAGALKNEAYGLEKTSSGSEKITDRSHFIVSSAERIHELFLHPFAFMQEVLKNAPDL